MSNINHDQSAFNLSKMDLCLSGDPAQKVHSTAGDITHTIAADTISRLPI